MNEEEYIEHEIVDRLYCLQEQDFDKTKVTNDYIQAVIKAGKENKKLVNKLQKENEKLNAVIEYNSAIYENNYVSKKKILSKIKELRKKGDHFSKNNPTGRVHFISEETDYKIEVLKELLGE